jgi:hypothetical protein
MLVFVRLFVYTYTMRLKEPPSGEAGEVQKDHEENKEGVFHSLVHRVRLFSASKADAVHHSIGKVDYKKKGEAGALRAETR